MKKQTFVFTVFLLAIVHISFSQSSFVDYQKSFSKVSQAFINKEVVLKKQFAAKHISWPQKYMYIRSFKYNGEMEVWVRNNTADSFTYFKTYKICALAGTLGPKRMEGDFQVPEGFYYINDFNGNSTYHLSLGLNYPNPADKLVSDSLNPGGDIYIHGSCITIGCIPINNDQIEELYVLSTYAKAGGQDFIPVHIFPAKYHEKKSEEYLENFVKSEPALRDFEKNLKKAYDFFEDHRKLPVVAVNDAGKYVFY